VRKSKGGNGFSKRRWQGWGLEKDSYQRYDAESFFLSVHKSLVPRADKARGCAAAVWLKAYG